MYSIIMGKRVHVLTDVNFETKTATCANCGEVAIKIKGKDKRGNIIYRCRTADMLERKLKKSPWRIFLGSVCVVCGFVPEHPCQLDIDHINGVKSDNSPGNLQTICANCHRLKTYLNRDWEDKSLRSIE